MTGKKKEEGQPPNFTVTLSEDEGKGTEFVSVAKSVLEGYKALSGTFNVQQVKIADDYHIGEKINQLVINYQQIIQGNVYGDVTQTSSVDFNQQVTDAFKTAYNMVDMKEDMLSERKEEIKKNLKTVEEELQSKEPDAGKIQRSWRWLKQNANWLVPILFQVVTEGIKKAFGT